MADQRVTVVGYDPAWPDQFAEQRPLVEELLRPWLAGQVEHIGSTAVPGLPAKPVIDMLAPVSSLATAQAAVRRWPRQGGCSGPMTRAVITGCGSCVLRRRPARIICM